MDRRHFVRFAAAAAAGSALERTRIASATAGSSDDDLRALLDIFLNEHLDDRPQFATFWGLDTGQRAAARTKLNDYSAAGRARWITLSKTQLGRLQHIDRRKLSPNAQIDFDVVVWQLEAVVKGGERFPFGEGPSASYAPYSPYVVSQLTGPYQSVPDFLSSQHPVRTADDAEACLARLDAFPIALEASTAALRADAARGVLAPDFALDTAIAQLTQLRAPAPAANSLTTSLAQRTQSAAISGDWATQAAAIVKDKIYPAIDRQRAAVVTLRARSSHDAGVWKLPDGTAFYTGALAFQTTTRRTPDDAHRLGLVQVAELTAKLDTRLRAEGLNSGPVADRLDALSRRPDQLYANNDAGRTELLTSLNAQTNAVRARLPGVFHTLPATPVEIVRVPAEIQDGAPNGYARPPSLDGSRPGRFYINLKDTNEWPKFSLPTLTYHEALPGHQWQIAIQLESKDIARLRQVTGFFAAYAEGWALYAEQLADELGMYDDYPLGRIGYLQSMLFRAVRLVVDTGIHAKRWTRERATDYLIAQTAIPRARAQREIDRYCVWPGQACSYKIGHAEWLRAREAVRTRMGTRFDLKAFHDVLRRGSMPLLVLQRTVQQLGDST